MVSKENKNNEKKQENHWKFEKEAIEYLAQIVNNTTICNIEYDCSDFSIKLSKNIEKQLIYTPEKDFTITKEPPKEGKAVAEIIREEPTKLGTYINAPMVGRFYEKASPTDKPYVEVGMQVKTGQTLCIVEAMKVMNHVKSTKDGVVKEILVKDGSPVEYGQHLIVIE